jgi:hypothetical protein
MPAHTKQPSPQLRFKAPETPTLIADVHGTLSNFEHRLKFVKGDNPDWDQFNRELAADLPEEKVINILRLAHQVRWTIILVTGTPERYHGLLAAWLRRHNIPFSALFMRRNGDYRSDIDVKRDMFEENFADYNIQFILEDRDKVVAFWRSLGLTCLQVKNGAY